MAAMRSRVEPIAPMAAMLLRIEPISRVEPIAAMGRSYGYPADMTRGAAHALFARSPADPGCHDRER